MKETQQCDNSLPVTVKKEVEKKSNQKQKNENSAKNTNKNGQTQKSSSNPDSTTPGTTKNQYYKGSGGANRYREQDAGGYGGGGGDDSSHNSDEDGNNNEDDEDENRDESEDEDEDYGGRGNRNTDGTVDEEGRDAKGNTINRNIVQLHFNQADYITPKCLKVSKISKALDYFVTKEALTRNDLRNVNGAYGSGKWKPQYALRVAPWYEKKYKGIMKDIGMPNAADEEMTEWYNAWREARKDGEWLDDDSKLQISNGYNQLMETKFAMLKNLLDGAPQLKGRASVKKLTPQDVKKWMQKEEYTV